MSPIDSFSNVVMSNKKYIEYLLFALIIVALMPGSLMGFQVGSQIKSAVRPVTDMMSHSIVQLLLLVLLIFSCCIKKDINMFLLLAVFMIISRR